MRFIVNFIRSIFYFFALVLILIIAGNVWVVRSVADSVFFDYDRMPDRDVALVLGTSPLLSSGLSNPFFESRMRAAAKLYKKGKVKRLIVSGDNRTRYYNEPAEMQKRLLELGVPIQAMTLDYAGLRTLDSIVRCKEIFGQNEPLIVTQAFHGYRALFIARYYNLEAVALAAQMPHSVTLYRMVYFREYLARVKAILDLYVFDTAPRYMGKKELLHY